MAKDAGTGAGGKVRNPRLSHTHAAVSKAFPLGGAPIGPKPPKPKPTLLYPDQQRAFETAGKAIGGIAANLNSALDMLTGRKKK
jgi:hypothetical protein